MNTGYQIYVMAWAMDLFGLNWLYMDTDSLYYISRQGEKDK